MAEKVVFRQDPMSRARRRDDTFKRVMIEDTRPVPPEQPASYRESLALALDVLRDRGGQGEDGPLSLAADKLRRDEQNNAEMVDTLVRAGYNDIPAQIDASVIRRLLGYATPR